MFKASILVTSVAIFMANCIHAQELNQQSLKTDLGFSQAALTQGKGNWQLDVSANYSYWRYLRLPSVDGFSPIFNTPGYEFRDNIYFGKQQLTYGIVDRLDVYGGVIFGRMDEIVFSENRPQGHEKIQTDQVQIFGGIRYKITNQKGALPTLIFSGDYNNAWKRWNSYFRFNLNWHYALGDRWNVRGQFGYVNDELDNNHFYNLVANVNAQYQWTQKWGVYAGGQVDNRQSSTCGDYSDFAAQTGVFRHLNDAWMVSGGYVFVSHDNFRSDLGSELTHEFTLKATLAF
jgi:hypothetical protein